MVIKKERESATQIHTLTNFTVTLPFLFILLLYNCFVFCAFFCVFSYEVLFPSKFFVFTVLIFFGWDTLTLESLEAPEVLQAPESPEALGNLENLACLI